MKVKRFYMRRPNRIQLTKSKYVVLRVFEHIGLYDDPLTFSMNFLNRTESATANGMLQPMKKNAISMLRAFISSEENTRQYRLIDGVVASFLARRTTPSCDDTDDACED